MLYGCIAGGPIQTDNATLIYHVIIQIWSIRDEICPIFNCPVYYLSDWSAVTSQGCGSQQAHGPQYLVWVYTKYGATLFIHFYWNFFHAWLQLLNSYFSVCNFYLHVKHSFGEGPLDDVDNGEYMIFSYKFLLKVFLIIKNIIFVISDHLYSSTAAHPFQTWEVMSSILIWLFTLCFFSKTSINFKNMFFK